MKLWERLFVFILEQELDWLADNFPIYSAKEDIKIFISNLHWVEAGIKNATSTLFQMFAAPVSTQRFLKI